MADNTPTVASQADYEAVQPGQSYVAPDGHTYTKGAAFQNSTTSQTFPDDSSLKPAQDRPGMDLANMGATGQMIHGALAAPIEAVNAINHYAPDIINPVSDPATGYPIDYGYGLGVAPPNNQKNVADEINQYRSDYEMNRAGGKKLPPSERRPDIPSDLAQALEFGAFAPEGATLKGAVALGALSGVLGDANGNSKSYGTDKAMQALFGAGIGAGGQYVARAINPTIDPSLALLLKNGVDPTTGQILRSAKGNYPAQAVGWLEAQLSGVPIMGPMIRTRQQEAVNQLNTTVANKALQAAELSSVPKTVSPGADTVAHVQSQLSKQYDKYVPQLEARLDPDLATVVANSAGKASLGSLFGGRNMGPIAKDKFSSDLTNYFSQLFPSTGPNTGILTGDALKGVESDLRAQYTNYMGSDDMQEQEIGERLKEIYDGLNASMQKYSDPEAYAKKEATDKGWAIYSQILRNSSAKANKAGGVATPGQLLDSSKLGDKSLKKGATARGEGLLQGTEDNPDLLYAGNKILTHLGDSQTAGREQAYQLPKLAAAMGGAGAVGTYGAGATGAEVGAGATLATLLAGAVGYRRDAQGAGRAFLTGRQGPAWEGKRQGVTDLISGGAGTQTSEAPPVDQQTQQVFGQPQHFADGGEVSAKADVFNHNQQYVKKGVTSFTTPLNKQDEANFQTWLLKNKVPFNPAEPHSDYDMRGYYKAMTSGDAKAHQEQNNNDGMMHFPDTYKTPYHHSFSNESQYATPDAPHWANDHQLMDKSGNVVFDEAPNTGVQQ